jgi:hypothetical protein
VFGHGEAGQEQLLTMAGASLVCSSRCANGALPRCQQGGHAAEGGPQVD